MKTIASLKKHLLLHGRLHEGSTLGKKALVELTSRRDLLPSSSDPNALPVTVASPGDFYKGSLYSSQMFSRGPPHPSLLMEDKGSRRLVC